jgi:membrane protease YdiL (CAAX protease family)
MSGHPSTRNLSQDSRDDYWAAARRPFASLVFLVPLLVLYEVGVWCCGGDTGPPVRNGVDFWIRGRLAGVGTAAAWLPPVAVLGGLLAWHLVAKGRWAVRGETLLGMFAESLVFAFLLLVCGQLQRALLATAVDPLAVHAAAARTVTYVGAGIYEELVFRLLLLPACYGLFRLGAATQGWSVVLAILTTSTAFSIAHYVGGVEAFALDTFAFRAFAGVYFAALFVTRGFGITVGAHATYDVVVGVLLAR